MTTSRRSLGLRRGAAAEAFFSPETTYGLTRGQPRQRTRPDTPEVAVERTATVVEHLQAPAETDIAIEGVETAVAVVEKPAYVNPHPGYSEWTDGELIPDHGEGYRWMDGLPAFLVEDRPQSNIR